MKRELNFKRDLSRVRYAAAQGARVAWYMGQYLLARRISGPFNRPGEPQFQPQAPEGDPASIRAAFLDLFAKDRANIEAGLYPAPNEVGVGKALSALRNSARFFRDLPRVDARRLQRAGAEVREAAQNGETRYPNYYLQNFHYQTGGWLSRESARLYDTQVEILFGGAAEAMRRIALGSLARALKGRDQRGVKLLDLACGNGHFLAQVLAAFPRLPATGLDLSPDYCAEARARLAPWPQVEIVTGAVEQAPFESATFAAATCVFLFHELPPRVRRRDRCGNRAPARAGRGLGVRRFHPGRRYSRSRPHAGIFPGGLPRAVFQFLPGRGFPRSVRRSRPTPRTNRTRLPDQSDALSKGVAPPRTAGFQPAYSRSITQACESGTVACRRSGAAAG